MRNRKKTLVVGAAIATFAVLAHAVPLSFHFEGVLTHVDSALSAIASVGEAFSGSYSVDSAAGDQLPALPKVGRYALKSFQVTIGGHSYNWTGSVGGVTVANLPADSFDVAVAGLSGPGTNGYLPVGAGFALRDSSGQALSDDGLPLAAPRVGDYDSAPFLMPFSRGPLGGSKPIVGQITEIDPVAAAVPEPESYVLMAAGLGLLAAVSGRRKQKAKKAA